MKWLETRRVLTVAGAVLLGAARAAMAADVPSARDFGGYPGYAGPTYRGHVTQALYIPAADGTRLAVDVHVPRGLQPGERVPTVLQMTRYWRAMSLRWPASLFDRDEFVEFFTRHGYAVVQMDVRGTGASFGTWPISYTPQEVRDAGWDVVEWIARQPWSNGKVGAQGISYRGNMAARLPIVNHPALKAVVPRFYEFDEYTDQPFAGGLCNTDFIELWGEANKALDSNDTATLVRLDGGGLFARLMLRGVKPVDADFDGSLLRAAIAEHAGNGDVLALATSVTYRDDVPTGYDLSIDDLSLYPYRDAVECSNAAYYLWGSWLDAGTANAVLHQFFTFKNPHRAVIGAWSHGARHDADQFNAPDAPVWPSKPDQMLDCLRFLDHYLRDADTGVMSERVLHYYTIGEAAWKTTSVWPPAGTEMRRWYLGPERTLSADAPAADEGADAYTVDWAATTGTTNRWYTQLGRKDVVYDARAEQLERTLSYRSAPLERDIEITGHPVVHLELRSTHADGAVYVYLDAEAPDGRIVYLTEGQLRLIHRKVRDDPPYTVFGPYHSFKRADGAPMVPGEVAAVPFALFPTSVRVSAGWRLRVSIAGHDADNFTRVPAEGDPVLTIERNAVHPSHIDLSIVPTS